jgi:hypothetical protein
MHLQSTSLRLTSVFYNLLFLDFQSSLFPSNFTIKILYTLLISFTRAICSAEWPYNTKVLSLLFVNIVINFIFEDILDINVRENAWFQR